MATLFLLLQIDNSDKLKRRLEKFGSVGSVGSPELEVLTILHTCDRLCST